MRYSRTYCSTIMDTSLLISQYSGNHGDRKCLIGLAVFQKKCEDLRMQLDNNKRQSRPVVWLHLIGSLAQYPYLC